jgi:hypothetical protein
MIRRLLDVSGDSIVLMLLVNQRDAKLAYFTRARAITQLPAIH